MTNFLPLEKQIKPQRHPLRHSNHEASLELTPGDGGEVSAQGYNPDKVTPEGVSISANPHAGNKFT